MDCSGNGAKNKKLCFVLCSIRNLEIHFRCSLVAPIGAATVFSLLLKPALLRRWLEVCPLE